MILFQSLKKNFSLTGKGFDYFLVNKCMLDIPSLTITISPLVILLVDSLLSVNSHKCERLHMVSN